MCKRLPWMGCSVYSLVGNEDLGDGFCMGNIGEDDDENEEKFEE